MLRNKPVLFPMFGGMLLLAIDISLALAGWMLMTEPVSIAPIGEGNQRALLEQPSTTMPIAGSAGDAVQSEALARPLFTSARRPYQPAAIVPAVETETEPGDEEIASPDYVLTGVFIEAGQRQALLRETSNGSDQWLSVGQTINEWQLVAVDQRQAVLKAGGIRVTLELYPSDAPPAQ